MADAYSVQETKRRAVPAKPLSTDELHGRVRMAFFEYTVPAGNQAIDDRIALCTLPPGCRFLGGELFSEGMTTGGAAASVQIGDGATADRFLGTTSIDAAAQVRFGNTFALGFGDRIDAETTLWATVKTEALAATKKFRGVAFYVHD